MLGADARWILAGANCDDAIVRAEPFEAVELDLGVLWEAAEDDEEVKPR